MEKEIEINESDEIVIITDSHTNLSNIKKILHRHEGSKVVCLGDITFLFSKQGDIYNSLSINFFIDNEIPCLLGNHESFILSAEDGSNLWSDKVACQTNDFNLNNKQLEYLRSLPRGFKLKLPNNKHYLLYHNAPKDLWGFRDKIGKNEFLETYPVNKDTRSVIIGHHHKYSTKIFNHLDCSLVFVGACSGKGAEYLTIRDRQITRRFL